MIKKMVASKQYLLYEYCGTLNTTGNVYATASAASIASGEMVMKVGGDMERSTNNYVMIARHVYVMTASEIATRQKGSPIPPTWLPTTKTGTGTISLLASSNS